MTYNKESNTVIMSADELSSYAVSKQNVYDVSAGFLRVEEIGDSETENDVPVRFTTDFKGLTLSVEGTAEKVIRRNGSITASICEYVNRLPREFLASQNPSLLAKAVVIAYALSKREHEKNIRTRISFERSKDGASAAFEREYSALELEYMTESLLSRAEAFVKVFAKRELDRYKLSSLAFPYKKIRSGQEQLMLGTMKTMRRGGKLVAAAPTGTGKTMATLYPALKALSEKYIDRIFYLTSKTIAGKAAYEAMELISEKSPCVRTVIIHSKERSCSTGMMKEGCRFCPRMNDSVMFGSAVQYKLREFEALAELLSSLNMYCETDIAAAADKYSVCPFELSLDISEWCDVIICDYNYVFDERMKLRRYFLEDRGEKYAFLIDEAHNLPDRIRAGYTAKLSPSDFSALAELVSSSLIVSDELSDALTQCASAFDEEKKKALADAIVVGDGKRDIISGFFKSDAVPVELLRSVSALGKICRKIYRYYEKSKHYDVLYETFSRATAFLAAAHGFGKGFVFLTRIHGDELTCSIVCMDPSEIISEGCERAYASVMFSATLSPSEYFADALGCPEKAVLEAESPFDPSRLSVTVFDGVSARLQDRRLTASAIAEIIKTTIDSKKGNYMAFFPSHSYMRLIAKELLTAYPDVRAVMQKEHMTYKEREKFISAFRSGKYGNILGLCVLGGIFSEGIDLAGDSLIGVISVGLGLSGLSDELNLTKEYYDDKCEMGYEYSYLYPAINKIEQAAGRVIRTADDKGCVVLIDDRLSSREITRRFPSFWQPVNCTSDAESLKVILDRFWNGKKNNI